MISWEVEGIIDFKLVRNKHKYELVFEEWILKGSLKYHIRGISHFSSAYIR